MSAAAFPLVRLLSATAILLGLIASCAPPAAPPASGASAPANAPAKPAPQVVRVTIPAEVELGHAVLQLGMRNGYFADEGLSPEFLLATGSIGIKALVAGEFDVSLTIGSATQAILGDAPLKVTYVLVNRPLWWVYGRGPVRTLKDVEGKTLGVGSVRDPSHVGTSLIMERQGADSSKVTAIGMGPPPKRLEGLIIGAIDAGVLVFPDNLRADEEGFHKLASFPDHFQLAMAGMTVRDDTPTNRAPLLEAFMRAANKSVERFRTNKEDAVGVLVDVMLLERARAEQLHAELAAMLAKDGTIDQETQRTSINVYGAALEDFDPNTVPVTKVFDFSVAERVARGTR